eukprot:1160123-Pelagomonas_calceolata.AAC.8
MEGNSGEGEDRTPLPRGRAWRGFSHNWQSGAKAPAWLMRRHENGVDDPRRWQFEQDANGNTYAFPTNPQPPPPAPHGHVP